MDNECTYCQALKYRNEPTGLCCANGKIKLPVPRCPVEPLLSYLIDIIAIINDLKEPTEISASNGETYKKQEIILIDEGIKTIVLNLRNDNINNFEGKKNDIIAISNVKIGEYKTQKTLVLTSASQIIINPDFPEANRLKEEFRRIEKKDIENVKFTKINLIQNLEDQIFININAVIDAVGEVDNVFSKNGQIYDKKEIVLIDDSNEKITLTLWNEFATNFMGKQNTKITLRNTKISNYKNQRYLTLNRQSIVSYDVDKTTNIKFEEWFNRKYNKGCLFDDVNEHDMP
ncbi:unnamed protein product [Macrosiphum euphorbiae]|uniref:Replication protein A OB domain-containing protein n=1 Tax=Macrosiphum euphorbiae TaxID=13131 RepID=A0AAV0VHD3_9HEMI|nr:unnamed protein product [Macrosiphum euphorbiae]